MDIEDVRIDVYRAGFNPPTVRATHIPTRYVTSSSATRSERQNRGLAVKSLARLVHKLDVLTEEDEDV